MDSSSTGEGPYSRSTMRRLAVTASVLSAVVIAWGVISMANGDPDGTRMLVIGLVVGAVMAVAIPLAKRRGRM